MSAYENGLQYKIICKDSTILDIYIGSTCNFSNRKRTHKTQCNNPNSRIYNLKVYKFIRANGGWNMWDMIKIEDSPCKTKEELRERERYLYDTLKPTLNDRSPTYDIQKKKTTTKIYTETHKAERQIYYDKHRAEIKAKQRARYALKKIIL